MSADFWAGYISGAVGIVIGNPLDILKVRRQTAGRSSAPEPVSGSLPSGGPVSTHRHALRNLATGTAAPILGYGALNALLFVAYNRSESALASMHPFLARPTDPHSAASWPNLYTTWIAGALGGLATWFVSTPTELIKCRVQLSPLSAPSTSFGVLRDVFRVAGLRGLYAGGGVTALRDAVGYGFYFWAYELGQRCMARSAVLSAPDSPAAAGTSAARTLLCGGVAGVVTWASIFPLDVVKTRVQAHPALFAAAAAGGGRGETARLLGGARRRGRRNPEVGAVRAAREAYAQGGWRAFFRGLGVCSVRAFVVNAVQWAVYEWVMVELGGGRAGSL
ncbi:hypothetical protein BROUX41_003623 [Berkeleyomyces rouxiae]|uniref:uncharacterized protein n=1 Tax=Berkeleyomyces rouxiae TaxID=2035830 RepID=UPI003B79DCFE